MKSTSNQNKLKTKFIYRISNKITQSLISILQGSITVLSVSKRFKGQIAHQSLALWEALLMTSVLRRAHNKIDHSWKRKQAHMRENEKKIVKNITCTIACGGALLAVRPTLFQPMWACGRFVRVQAQTPRQPFARTSRSLVSLIGSNLAVSPLVLHWKWGHASQLMNKRCKCKRHTWVPLLVFFQQSDRQWFLLRRWLRGPPKEIWYTIRKSGLSHSR